MLPAPQLLHGDPRKLLRHVQTAIPCVPPRNRLSRHGNLRQNGLAAALDTVEQRSVHPLRVLTRLRLLVVEVLQQLTDLPPRATERARFAAFRAGLIGTEDFEELQHVGDSRVWSELCDAPGW